MTSDLLKLIPTMQSISLLERNLPSKKKKDILSQGFENIVGLSLIKVTADSI